MNPVQTIPAGLALAFAAVFAYRPIIQWNLQHDVFMRVLVRLIDNNELERAARLCEAAPAGLLPRAILPVLACALNEPADALPALAAVTRTSLEQGEARLGRWTWVGVAAGLALGIALVATFATFDPTQPAAWILMVVTVAVLGGGGYRIMKLRDALQTMPVSLLQPLVKQLSGQQPEAERVVQAVLEAGQPTA